MDNLPNASQLNILTRRAKVAELTLRGCTQVEICRRLGMDDSQQQLISHDLKVIKRQWRETAQRSIGDQIARELAKIDAVEKEYWDAWDRSKVEKTRSSTKRNQATKQMALTQGGSVDVPEKLTETAEIVKEKRDGNPAFLAGVERCIERRCKLLGLDAAGMAREGDGQGEKPVAPKPKYDNLDPDELRVLSELRRKLFEPSPTDVATSN